MKWIILFTYFLLSACTPQTEVESDPSIASSDGKGGAKITPSHPAFLNAVALVVRKAGDENNGKVFCSGNLHKGNLVVTARHCVRNSQGASTYSNSEIGVFFGADVAAKGIELKVLQIFAHPTADVALLRLAGAAPKGYLPLEILPPHEKIIIGEKVAIAGFGLIEKSTFDKKQSNTLLREGNAQVKSTQGRWLLTHPGKFNETTCNGDSGSAAIVLRAGRAYSVGVAHGGGMIWDPCFGPDAQYEKIGPLKSWIDGHASTKSGASKETE